MGSCFPSVGNSNDCKTNLCLQGKSVYSTLAVYYVYVDYRDSTFLRPFCAVLSQECSVKIKGDIWGKRQEERKK